MKSRKYVVLLTMLLLWGCSIAYGHDFVVTINGQKVFFSIKSSKNRTAEVTYNGSIADAKPTYYEGDLTVPDKVKHQDVIYTIVGVSAKAFSGADKLTAVTLPSGIVSIGDFAFEGCTSLRKVIFPGNEVKFGQGVFFKCDKIQDVSLGSDWKEVDLKMFRWSDSLKVIALPAKVERVLNFKSLKNLRSVSVDVNNTRFSSIDGILYNSKNELLGCPRAYEGRVRIAEGTYKVVAGALADCKGITGIDCPESLASLSFKECAYLSKLDEIIFRGDVPMKTAQRNGADVFLLQTANPDVKIVVPRTAKENYKTALVQQAGEYTEIGDTIPFLVEQGNMPKVKNIVGVKSFDKYNK